MNRFGCKRAVAIMTWFTCSSLQTNKILLTQRRKTSTFPGYYAAVGGKVDEGECAILTAQREMQEETGVFVMRDNFHLVDVYSEDDFACYIFETVLGLYRFNDFKNIEPKKHAPWKLYTVQEAIKLKPIMPALQQYLLTKQQTLAKLA